MIWLATKCAKLLREVMTRKLELKHFDRHKTLEELEGDVWGKPPFPSHLVMTCYALRKKILKDFTVEDLRIKIGQNDSLKYLIPLAIEVLQKNPFADGDYYEGDLLGSVLSVKKEFWQENLDFYEKVENILQSAENIQTEEAEEILTVMLPQKIYDFRKNKPQTNG